MNVTYPLIPEEIVEFCAASASAGDRGRPAAYLEEGILATLRRHDVNGVRVHGKDLLPMAGEYTARSWLRGLAQFLGAPTCSRRLPRQSEKQPSSWARPLPTRPPGFCVGCPERPVFAAMKLVEKEVGKYHVSADIGCHTFATLPPFNIGTPVLGYGLGLASNSAVHPMFGRRTVTIMGDGGFWHNGLTSGVANAVFNRDDGILVIMKNATARRPARRSCLPRRITASTRRTT
jgi:indolepyruvate ferredoxin oxidoreductase alpha subunit